MIASGMPSMSEGRAYIAGAIPVGDIPAVAEEVHPSAETTLRDFFFQDRSLVAVAGPNEVQLRRRALPRQARDGIELVTVALDRSEPGHRQANHGILRQSKLGAQARTHGGIARGENFSGRP